jgi:hypothetical protein
MSLQAGAPRSVRRGLAHGDAREVEGSDSMLTYRLQSIDVLPKDQVPRNAEEILAQNQGRPAGSDHLGSLGRQGVAVQCRDPSRRPNDGDLGADYSHSHDRLRY